MKLEWVTADNTTAALVKAIESSKEPSNLAFLCAVSDTEWGISCATECTSMGFTHTQTMIIVGGGTCASREDGKKKCEDYLKKLALSQIEFWHQFLGESN